MGELSTIDFGALTDKDILAMGMQAGEDVARALVRDHLASNDSLIVVVGVIEKDDEWRPWGSKCFGQDAERFAANIDAQTGKLNTSLRYEMNSGEAVAKHGDEIAADARRYTGGVFHVAHVETVDRGYMARRFAGTASGMQGHFDETVVSAILSLMGALWALKMQALYSKP